MSCPWLGGAGSSDCSGSPENQLEKCVVFPEYSDQCIEKNWLFSPGLPPPSLTLMRLDLLYSSSFVELIGLRVTH